MLNIHDAEYLLIGGYAVIYYSFPRNTGDIDVWIGADPLNTAKVAAALREFGFVQATSELFAEGMGTMVRMGVAPLRIEILTKLSGVDFAQCFENRVIANFDGLPVNLIGLDDLKTNKKASGRLKDLADLEQLDQA